MRLATYDYGDGVGPGLVEGESIRDLRGLAPTLADLLGNLERVAGAARACPVRPLEHRFLLAPIPEPRRIVGVGLNYISHARETGREPGPVPTVFAKLAGSVTRPEADVPHPGGEVQLDYEGEVGLVIGRRCHRADCTDALQHVAGLVIVNDLTDRALARPETLVLAKSLPRSTPMGPWITTLDEAPAAEDLRIRTTVNGELRQDGCAAEMIHDFAAILAFVSASVVLEPGDIVITGSPAGSGAGFEPPRWLKPGDVVRVEVTELGAIEQRITT